MPGILLAIPFFLIRFTLLSAIDKKAIQRAAHFTPMQGNEKIAYYVYQLCTVILFVFLCFLSVDISFSWNFLLPFLLYGIGLWLCAISIIEFAKPTEMGLHTSGIYAYSRNPMYVAYFLYFLGCAFLTHSLFYFLITLLFQITAHWIILAEERWCIENFKGTYLQYKQQVRRYI